MSTRGANEGPPTPAEQGAEHLAKHLTECRGVDAAVVVQSGSADDLVARMIEAGWTYQGVEYLTGKRVRYLAPPPGCSPDGGATKGSPSPGRGPR